MLEDETSGDTPEPPTAEPAPDIDEAPEPKNDPVEEP